MKKIFVIVFILSSLSIHAQEGELQKENKKAISVHVAKLGLYKVTIPNEYYKDVSEKNKEFFNRFENKDEYTSCLFNGGIQFGISIDYPRKNIGNTKFISYHSIGLNYFSGTRSHLYSYDKEIIPIDTILFDSGDKVYADTIIISYLDADEKSNEISLSGSYRIIYPLFKRVNITTGIIADIGYSFNRLDCHYIDDQFFTDRANSIEDPNYDDIFPYFHAIQETNLDSRNLVTIKAYIPIGIEVKIGKRIKLETSYLIGVDNSLTKGYNITRKISGLRLGVKYNI